MSNPGLSPHAAGQALQSALRRSAARAPVRPRLIVAGATGVLGNEVMHRLVGSGQYSHTEVVACAPMSTGMASVGIALAGGEVIDDWPARPLAAHTGLVMFEPPRLYHGRERSLWTPQPGQLPALARWLRRCGVETLVVVLPHDTGRLPEALKRGLANLDELGVAALGFERLLLVRSARKPVAAVPRNVFEKTAAFMLSTLAYMIPASEQPVRPAKLAQFVDAALRVLPPGTHVAPPELLHRANQTSSHPFSNPRAGADDAGMHALVHSWLEAGQNRSLNPESPGP
jgi:hypothetical protein